MGGQLNRTTKLFSVIFMIGFVFVWYDSGEVSSQMDCKNYGFMAVSCACFVLVKQLLGNIRI